MNPESTRPVQGSPVLARLRRSARCWVVGALLCCATCPRGTIRADVGHDDSRKAREAAVERAFQESVQPFLSKYCIRCHNQEKMKSGIRVDHLDGGLAERNLRLWEAIQELVVDEEMPPRRQAQPTADERRLLNEWIEGALDVARSRPREKNGSVRRLTVAQYRNTLQDLLGIADDLTDVLPADGASRDGFTNNEETLELSPLLVETYFEIADKALGLAVVDPTERPVIQRFRVDLGEKVNPEPCPDKLILGANSALLENDELLVTQTPPKKPFDFLPFAMRTKYRFVEGYQGNATVRGWRDYDSIYHAVFAGMRGSAGYPRGLAHEGIPGGLLLRPAIPSAEVFGVQSTYGPHANFKISVRELPDAGRFRVTVRAAKYDDGLLLGSDRPEGSEQDPGAIVAAEVETTPVVRVPEPGLYQADVYLKAPPELAAPQPERLEKGLLGSWPLDGTTRNARHPEGSSELTRELATEDSAESLRFVESPFGQAVSIDAEGSATVVIPRDKRLDVGDGDFTVAAWIHPGKLRQAGIVCRGAYGYTHGWLVDMPNDKGVLRIETSKSGNLPNGTVSSPAGVIQAGRWQHIAVTVRRGDGGTRLYVNGFEIEAGTVAAADLDNPDLDLHIGRVPNAARFAGKIDEVRLYRRALEPGEVAALVEPGREFAKPPPRKPGALRLTLGARHFSNVLKRPPFVVARLPAGPLSVSVRYTGQAQVDRVVLTPVHSLELVEEFERFERRVPRVGVHLGLRRDCGSTFKTVGSPQAVVSTQVEEFVFEGAINNYPRPEVEKDNVNYLAGIREIAVRSEYTDGRDMPRLLVQSVAFEGPFYETWPPATHRRIFIESPHRERPDDYAHEIVRSFATRAFRRPPTEEEVASLRAVWSQSHSSGRSFEESIKDALVTALTSPQFLFLIEDSKSPEAETLESYELASKLSYFLWNTGPDEALLRLAASGRLLEAVDSELERMVFDPRFRQFAEAFTTEWLSLDKLAVVEVDQKRFPRLGRDAKAALQNEPIELLMHLVRENLPLSHLVQSDFIMANEVVASYYGLGDRIDSGFEFVALRHERKELGGLLSQAGVLAGLSDGRESNPIKRGAWLARKIIAEPPDDPPPNVPELPHDDDESLTLRQKLERHRDQPGCAKCHEGIDPWGLPLEQFDAGGRLKQEAVDANSTLPDGTEIAGTNALKAYLAAERLDQVAFSVLKHLSSYASGRSLGYNEIDVLKKNGLELRTNGYRMLDVFRFVIRSELFLEK